MDGTRLWYVNVYVRDLEKAVGFFRDTLGLPLRFWDEAFGYASFDAGGVGLALARIEGDDTQGLVGRHTGIGIGVGDLASAHRDLERKGVRFTLPPTRQPWGGTLAMFEDPDANVFFLDQLREE
ncbi:MAG: VOC family protein [Myxococcota bacterium]